MSLTLAPTRTADKDAIEELLHLFGQQKAELKATEQSLAATKAQIEHALGHQDVCAIAGLGEVRRIPPTEMLSWNTKKLKALQAALLLIGEDKLAGEIEAARTITMRKGYLQVKLESDSDESDK